MESFESKYLNSLNELATMQNRISEIESKKNGPNPQPPPSTTPPTTNKGTAKNLPKIDLPKDHSPTELLRYANDVLKSRNIKGQVLFVMVSGSKAFNLNVASSDSDYFGVYAANSDDCLRDDVTPTIDTHEPADTAIYELSKYVFLLTKGNPKVIEPLFTDRLSYQSADWLELKISLRNQALNENTRQQYFSYAFDKVRDLTGTEADFKSYYHAIRLMKETQRIEKGLAPLVWFSDGSVERDELIGVRKGKYSLKELAEWVEKLKAQSDPKLNPSTILAPSIDQNFIDSWLIQTRLRRLKSENLNYIQPKSTSNEQQNAPLASSQQQPQQEAAKQAILLLQKAGLSNSRLLCCVRSGSDASGVFEKMSTHVPDFFGVYSAPLENVMSNFSKPSRGIVTQNGPGFQHITTSTPTDLNGMVLYEVGLFLNMLLAGNHRAMESLFFTKSKRFDPSIDFVSSEWMSLVEMREKFVFRGGVEHCRGLAEAIRKRVANSQWNPKDQYLFLKYTRYAEELVKNGQINVQPATPESEKFENSVRNDRMKTENFLAQFKPDEKMKVLGDLIKSATNLKSRNDGSIIQDWFLIVRKRSLSDSSKKSY